MGTNFMRVFCEICAQIMFVSLLDFALILLLLFVLI